MVFSVPGFSALIVLITLAVVPLSVYSDGLAITPRTTLSVSSYKFTQSERPNALTPTGINGNDFPEVDFDVTFKILGLGTTFSKEEYYLDLLVQKSLEEEDDFTLIDPLIPGGQFTETFTGDREDLTIAIGKKVFESRGSVYLGYKYGRSQAEGNQGQELSFEENGIFIGSNYSWPVTNSSVITLNLALAKLDGELREDVNHPFFTSLNPPLDINATSDTQGLSYGISWSSRISETLSYSIGLESKVYSFENIRDVNPNVISSDQFKEEFLSTNFSLYYMF